MPTIFDFLMNESIHMGYEHALTYIHQFQAVSWFPFIFPVDRLYTQAWLSLTRVVLAV